MTRDEHRELYEYAVSNRERIKGLEADVERVRGNVHNLRAEAAAIRYLAEKVADIAKAVHDLTADVETIAKRAMHRPQQTTLALVAQYASIVISLVALYLVASK